MNTVWTFGDSFVDNKEYRPHGIPGVEDVPDHWSDQIAKSLNYKLENFGKCGSGLSYTFYNVMNCLKQMQDNDVVVVALTDSNRRWFFFDRPTASTRLIEFSMHETSKDEIKAYKQFILHLDKNPIEPGIYIHNFLMMLDYFATKKKVKIIVLKCFGTEHQFVDPVAVELENIAVAEKALGDISFEEYYRYIRPINPDFRVSHLSKCNHTILANKILDFVNNGTPIDLSTNFRRCFINNKFLEDPNIHYNELFNFNLKD